MQVSMTYNARITVDNVSAKDLEQMAWADKIRCNNRLCAARQSIHVTGSNWE